MMGMNLKADFFKRLDRHSSIGYLGWLLIYISKNNGGEFLNQHLNKAIQDGKISRSWPIPRNILSRTKDELEKKGIVRIENLGNNKLCHMNEEIIKEYSIIIESLERIDQLIEKDQEKTIKEKAVKIILKEQKNKGGNL